MKVHLAFIRINLKLAFRDKSVIFFNYLFPLIFFFLFAQLFHAGHGGAIDQMVAMVLVIGILGNGLFGAGMRAVQERETNILRRFKVTPITPTPLLVGSMITGWVIYMPVIFLVLILAHLVYGMTFPERWLSLLVMASLGILAFRALGLIIASVVNSFQESNIVIQLIYMPMLFLSGATIPLAILPQWAQLVAQFIPAYYLVVGMQATLFRKENLVANWYPLVALALTTALATFISGKLFRWEKEERIRPYAKLWIAAVLLPFLALGIYEYHTGQYLKKSKALWHEIDKGAKK
jgi:ABC-type multidrug transport system permease subunit